MACFCEDFCKDKFKLALKTRTETVSFSPPTPSPPPPPFRCLEKDETLDFDDLKGGEGGCNVSLKNGPNGEKEGAEHEVGHSRLCARGHWKPAEDSKLRDLVAQYGPQNWNLIAQKLQGRSGKSCRLRWFNQLDPRINKKSFTEEEEEMLLSAHRLHGNKWALIARLFPGRTDNAVKNHWHVIMARRQREDSNVYRRRNNSFSSSSTISSISPLDSGAAVDNSGCSDSNSESSATDESVVNNGFLPEMKERERAKISLRFIDFLGVGDI